MPDLKAELARALAIEDQTERQLEVVAIVSEAVADLGVRPVVVGGLAVAYWTAGTYLTGDIDLLMPSSPAVDERLRSLGFEREGRFWLIAKAELFLEAPGSFLKPGAEAQEVTVASGRPVRVIRPEDVLVGRLHEFVATGHSDPLGQAFMLLDSSDLERGRLASLLALEGVERGERLESWELHDAARRLR
jgi:hypothetical protein